MINFRTELIIPPVSTKISIKSRLFAMGSCFASVMGEKLKENKLHAIVNPFGIIFNPVSLQKIPQIVADKKARFDERLIAEHNGLFFHYDVHSEISATSAEALSEKLSQIALQTDDFLKKTDFMILTLGTAFVYELLAEKKIVANCHKMPSALFEKKLLQLDEITESLQKLVNICLAYNPDMHLILTVSPVRHIKDTLTLNQVSKSLLRVACHHITEKFPKKISYFPAYELLNDDLRDYRFYKPDLIHPSETAELYIWEKFTETYFDRALLDFLKKWDKISKALAHKPFHANSAEYLHFKEKLLQQLFEIRHLADVEKEIFMLSQQR
jgi:hypothetical protein